MLKTKGSFVLNVFSDASKDVYGAAAYITDCKESKLLFGRAQVAPIKELTLLQLELTALTLAVRISRFILGTLLKD